MSQAINKNFEIEEMQMDKKDGKKLTSVNQLHFNKVNFSCKHHSLTKA